MRIYTPAICPHCGGQYLTNTVASHARRCAMAPEWYAATKAALDDGTGRILSQDAYRKKEHTNVIGSNGLRKQFGHWESVAAAFGLRYAPDKGGRVAAPVRDCPADNPAQVAATEARLLAEEAERSRWLHAYRVIESEREVRYVLR